MRGGHRGKISDSLRQVIGISATGCGGYSTQEGGGGEGGGGVLVQIQVAVFDAREKMEPKNITFLKDGSEK